MTATKTEAPKTPGATSAWGRGDRPLTIAVLAMGGEGGGVLSNWIADTGREQGWIAQNTSVAGVAQRTGATVYYIEMYPPTGRPDGSFRSEPVMSTMPTPGQVDVVVASELMEAGRAVQRGFVTPDRTTLIASTNRVYSIDEKSRLGDGRVDSSALLAGAENAAKVLVSSDFMKLAVDARSVISASLFGALAGSGALPFTREQFEQTIRATGKGVEPSLRAFAAGFDVAREARDPKPATASGGEPVLVQIGRRPRTPEEDQADRDRELSVVASRDPRSLVGPLLAHQADRIGLSFPAASRLMLLRGCARTAMYQDVAYADRYLNRVARLLGFEKEADGEARMMTEAARWIALWMCYQDTIHVGLQKSRRARIAGIRDEARAEDEQPVQVREYLHPQLEEITDTLPVGLGAYLRESAAFAKLVHLVAHKGIVVNTTGILGYTTMSTLARLRPIRPRSLRFGVEQRKIDLWLDRVGVIAQRDYDLAVEVVCCARVLKGYGETWARGEKSFDALMVAADALVGRGDAAATLKRLRDAALVAEDGGALEAALEREGLA
ncbi:indolepyruvate oxidoreductase subunit beta family protein [Mariniluteicoccus flavus]